MSAGEFRHRIEVQTSTVTGYDSHGGEIVSWATTSTIWASVQTLTGRKLEIARQINTRASVEVRTRLCSTGTGGFTTDNRLLFGSRILEPIYTVNEHERNITLMGVCSENING
jgi:SPP1 family predicted phage head-tail adaptor